VAFQGSLRELPLPDVIQLVAVSGKTGAFTLKNRADNGKIFLRRGQIVHATVGTLAGEQAVYELARWSEGEFSFSPDVETEVVSVEKSNTNLLMEAARQIDEWKILSKKIGSTRMVPVFAPQASRVSVSFTPPEWAVITKVDERRSIDEIGRLAAGEQASLAEQIHRGAQQLLGGGEWHAELDSALRLCRAEMDAGRGADAILDLVRAEEKLVSAHAGPNQAKSFLDKVATVLRSS
jgi:hypothetical protein